MILPLTSLLPHAGQFRARIIEAQYVFIPDASVAHDSGTYLTKPHSVSPPSAMEDDAVCPALNIEGR